ncbi:MAG: HAD family hydrolase [Muribaculaceae bacterium]|nr:HAD family hydrolase [Muribaculaceae bacterium]
MNLEEYCRGVKGVVLDYGGTLDSRGEHWSEVLWRGWQNAGADFEFDREKFLDAYVYAERLLAKEVHILPDDDFLTLLLKKINIEMNAYASADPRLESAHVAELARRAALYCDSAAREVVAESRDTLLQPLAAAGMPMVLVSNFYGNVESVLEEYGVRRYMKEIIESAVVGVRKPDPEIFRLGVKALGLEPSEVIVVGDSYRKDIEPALKAGCRAVWLKGKGWGNDETAIDYPYCIKSLSELTSSLINEN